MPEIAARPRGRAAPRRVPVGRVRGAVASSWLTGASVVAVAVLVTVALASRCPPAPPRVVGAALSASVPARVPAPDADRLAPAAAAPAARAREAEAVARWRTLRAGGLLRGEVVTFLGCPGEAWRKVETDPRGQVVRYVRHGVGDGVPFEAELFYGEDGLLAAVRYREAHGAWRELRLSGAPGDPPGAVPAQVLDPARAAEAGPDAAPRCRF